MTMVVAGHETTALACAYAVVLLHDRNRAFLQELRANEGPVAKDVSAYLDGKLEHSKALVKESMRYIPPAWVVGREAQEDVEIEGFIIRKGTQVYLPQCVVHRDPRWFDDPESFLPQRWLEPEFEDNLPRFAYFPFGGGPRTCIGNHFAMMEATLILAKILDETELEVETHFDDLSFTPSITLRPAQPVWVSAHMRD
jgi:cytochrome P450